jgi:A/G-specific adenine glycosylase
VRHLAEASQDRVLKLWEGLGYYTRARNLQKAAQTVLQEHAGIFPRDPAAVLALPGIGPYTAGAICSIAYNQPTPILDGNVIRVLTRIHGIPENPREPATNKQLWALATELVTTAANLTPAIPDACSHLNQSLMELGALICSPRQPNCLLCPVRKHCVAYETGQTESLPNLGERAAPTARRFLAFVLEQDGRYLVQQRPAGVVNAHLWEFPNLEASPADDALALAKRLLQIKSPELQPLTVIKHAITRYRITLEVYRVTGKGQPAAGENSAWKTKAELAHLAFTSAHGKIRRLLEREKTEKKPTKPRS